MLPEVLQQEYTRSKEKGEELFFFFDGEPQYPVDSEVQLKKIRLIALEHGLCDRIHFDYQGNTIRLTEFANLIGDGFGSLFRDNAQVNLNLALAQHSHRSNRL